MTKFPENEYLFPTVADSSRLLIGCRREDFSASRIARAVEDCNAHLLNLNVTRIGDDYFESTGGDNHCAFPVLADLRVSHRDAAMVSRSLERYGYSVLDFKEDGTADSDTLRERVDYFFRILES